MSDGQRMTGFTRRQVLRGGLSLAAIAGIAAFAGCAPDSRPGARNTLRILCDPGTPPELAGSAKLFEERTGTRVEFITLPYNGVFNRYVSEFSSGQLSFDIAAVDSVWLGIFGPAFASVDELYTSQVRRDLIPAAVDEATIDGRIVGIPMWVNSEILYYRKDLFENSAEQREFENKYGYPLSPPTDWEQFQDAAEFFTRGSDLYGTDVKGNVETEWLMHALQAGASSLVVDGDRVVVDDDAHRKALEFSSGLATRVGVNPPGAAQTGWAESFNLFSQGNTAMMRYWTHGYTLIDDTSPVHGKVGVAPMIAGPAGRAGIPGNWHLCLPQKGPKHDTALEFLRFAYEHNELNANSPLGLVARTSAFQHYADQGTHPQYQALLETLSSPLTQIRPVTPRWQEMVDRVLVPTVQKSVVRGADIPTLLGDARKEIENIVF